MSRISRRGRGSDLRRYRQTAIPAITIFAEFREIYGSLKERVVSDDPGPILHTHGPIVADLIMPLAGGLGSVPAREFSDQD